MKPWLIALCAIITRENLRFVRQRGRFLAALVRPLVWLVVFAAGFRAALGCRSSRPTRPISPTRSISYRGFAHDPAIQRHAVVAVARL